MNAPKPVAGSLFELSAYDYFLPESLIAQTPVHPRDASRLLVVHRDRGTWEHRNFRDLPEYLDQNDLLVANNTRVLKARLLGHRLREEKGKSGIQWVAGGKVEFVLLEQIRPQVREGLFHASAKYVPGLRFYIPTPDGKGLHGVLIRGSAESPTGTVVAEFDRDPVTSGAGEIPLPHYIHRGPAADDEADYQTIYAKSLGSAAAPTAGLHFTEEVLQDLRQKGVGWTEITLNVGLGTFRPVKVEDIRLHPMHEEKFEISPEVAAQISQWKGQKKRVVAVGTTAVRAMESAAKDRKILSGIQKTALFIKPGEFEFQIVDRLITNFHLPKSTLLMLVSAFAGRELTLAAYEDAVKNQYRFFSYGDAMLIL